MQGTTTAGRLYQPLKNRSEEFFSVTQVKNTTPNSLISQQLHWKKKNLTKADINKRRQNPARQAAVRSFKKFQFSNQDFLLKKYFRSVKKEYRPKESDHLLLETMPSFVKVTRSAKISKQMANNNCVKRVSGFNDLRNKISYSTNNTSTSSKLINNNNKNMNNLEAERKINSSQEFNLNEEIKKCKRKNWRTRGLERSTYENTVIDSPTLVVCNELKEIINESGDFIAQYCKSLKDLSDIINYDDSLSNDCSSSGNSSGNHATNKNVLQNQSAEKIHCTGCCERATDITENNRYICCVNNIESKDNCRVVSDEKYYMYTSTSQTERIGHYDCVKENDYNDEEGSDDDDNGYKNYDNLCDVEDDSDDNSDREDEDDSDGDDGDDDSDKDDSDDDSDKDDDENENKDNDEDNCNDDDSSVEEQVNHDISLSENNVKNRSSDCINVRNDDYKKNPDNMSLDSTDSSSISSSVDNTSVSTETCSDNQVMNSDNQDFSEFKMKNNNSCASERDDDELQRKKVNNLVVDGKKPHFIKVTKADLSEIDSFQSVKEYPKKTQSNHQSKRLRPSVVRPLEHKISAGDKTSFQHKKYYNEKNQSASENSVTIKSTSPVQKMHYIKIRNREYPISILDNNPTLIDYLKETQPQTLPENVLNGNARLFTFNKADKKSSAEDTCDDSQTQNKRLICLRNGKDLENNQKLSTTCSVEDGLAFLDKQNLLPQTKRVKRPTSNNSKCDETITLYNHSTFCTLPYTTSTSQDLPKNSLRKKSIGRHQNTSSDQSALQNSTASQANLSSIRESQSFSSFEGSQFQCLKCKTADSNLKASLKESLASLNELITGSMVLNSLITEESISDNVTQFLENLNSL